MRVAEPIITRRDDGTRRVELLVGDFPLWYEVPDSLELSTGGEFIVAAGLLPAMIKGEALELPPGWGLDPIFRANVDRVQELMVGWQRKMGLKLARVDVTAEDRPVTPAANNGVMSFFSGGVDGSYTAMKNRERIRTLVLLRGIDMQLENAGLWEQASAAAGRLADHWNLPLVAISTNVRFLGYHMGFKWARHFQAAGLSSVAHLVPHREALIAASHAIDELMILGSHMMLDPLWSSGSTSIVHDGPLLRSDKLEALAAEPLVLEVLRVCWHDSGFNCCRCEKCLRTMVALHLLGRDALTFPMPIDWKAVGRLRVDGPIETSFLRDLQALERKHPNPAAKRALNRVMRRSALRAGLRNVDQALGSPLGRWRGRYG